MTRHVPVLATATGTVVDGIMMGSRRVSQRHPVGATGGMLMGTLLDELERRDLATGLVTMCTGGGMATATIIEGV